MSTIEYVREEDRQEYRKFCMHHIPAFRRPSDNELWHYTNADGLIGILKSGQILSTQVSCLNDSLEQRYFASLVHAEIKVRQAQNTDANLAVSFEWLMKRLLALTSLRQGISSPASARLRMISGSGEATAAENAVMP